jgi:hypothetical protein
MIFLYTVLLFLLGTAKALVGRRVARLEKQYERAAQEAEQVLREIPFREGNSARQDPCKAAKRQYQLGVLVQKRDRLEERYHASHRTWERVSKLVDRVQAWKGRKLPYTMGVLDVSGLLWLIDYLGVGDQLSARHLVEMVRTWVQG